MSSVEHRIFNEEERVRIHRRRVLRQMGLSRGYARLLGDSEADLHQILALLRNGATPDQIRRIVL